FIAARIWRLTDYGLFGDEIFSMQAIGDDWSGVITNVIADGVHPPLFYLLLKAWTVIGGESLFWLKLLPLLISIVSILPFFLLCRELKLGPGAINLSLGLMACNGFLVTYAQELRMYSMLQALAISSLWLFTRLINSRRDAKKAQLALFVCNLILIYT